MRALSLQSNFVAQLVTQENRSKSVPKNSTEKKKELSKFIIISYLFYYVFFFSLMSRLMVQQLQPSGEEGYETKMYSFGNCSCQSKCTAETINLYVLKGLFEFIVKQESPSRWSYGNGNYQNKLNSFFFLEIDKQR